MALSIFSGRRKWLALGFGVILLALVLVVLRLRTPPEIRISPETTFVEGPLDADGNVDYAAAINAKISAGVTPQNNAVVLLMQALGPEAIPASIRREFFAELGVPPPSKQGTYFVPGNDFADRMAGPQPRAYSDALEEETGQGISAVWSREELPKLAAWLRANEEPLAIVIRATERPKWYCPLVFPAGKNRKLLDVMLPLFNVSRDLAHALASRALLAVNEGRYEDAKRDLTACRWLARRVAEGHSMVDYALACAVEAITWHAEIAAIGSGRLTATQWADYQQALSGLQPLKSPAETVNFGTRLHMLDAVGQIAKGEDEPGIDDLDDALDRFLLPSVFDWNTVLETINERVDELYAVLRQPRGLQRQRAIQEYEARFFKRHGEAKQDAGKWFQSTTERSKWFATILFGLFAPATRDVHASHHRAVVRFELLPVAIALERHRLAIGRFPAKLTELQPRYLKTIPQDLFGEKPLRYKPSKTGYVLYSVGPNGKDDGGLKQKTGEGDDIVVRMERAK